MTDHHTITDRDTQPGALTDARASLPGRDTGRVDTTRSCPVCGTRFAPSPRKPTHTYCCERCRATAWRHRRRDAARRVAELTAERATSSSTTSTTTTDANHVTHDVGTNNAGENEDRNEVTAVQNCPHCRQPIALITLIVSPAAAHVTIPTPPPIPTRRGRSG